MNKRYLLFAMNSLQGTLSWVETSSYGTRSSPCGQNTFMSRCLTGSLNLGVKFQSVYALLTAFHFLMPPMGWRMPEICSLFDFLFYSLAKCQ